MSVLLRQLTNRPYMLCFLPCCTALQFIHLWPCAMLAAGLMLVLKCMSADQARDSVEWTIYVSVC